jgi:D-sedoheptulose 7-phosphate isomerase
VTLGSAELAHLYPFLDGEGGDSAHDELLASITDKYAESAALRIRVLEQQRASLQRCALDVARSFKSDATVFSFGNGGSATDASAFADSLARLGPARALTDDVAVTTALANDIGFERALARQLVTLARPGDVAAGFSTSGSSENVATAFRAARDAGLLTIGFSGYDGGRFATDGTVDHLFVVPSTSVHRIQEAQTAMAAVLCQLVGVALEHEEAPWH